VAHLVEIAFRGNRKEFFLWDYPEPPPIKAAVIVDADRGEDLGHVYSLGDLAQIRNGGCPHGCGTTAPTRKALRLANARDMASAAELVSLNDDVRRKAMERVRANGLGMKMSDAEWQWDRKKLTFYFTAEKRVDFRNLVRDLAALFRTRIELKQIGVRDEAKRLDGIGRCGRQYCSASWLPELRPVNLGVAKDQRLSLNPAQISGACGRLMCCLRYEHDFYVQSRKRFPKEGKIFVTATGEEKLMAIDIFHERLTFRTTEGDTRVVTLADFNRAMLQPFSAESEEALNVSLPAEDSDSGEVYFDVSPELLYTAEHEVPPLRQLVVLDSPLQDGAGADTDSRIDDRDESSRAESESAAAPDEVADASAGRGGERDESLARRRRGRRGGKRGRGNTGTSGTEPGNS